MPLDLSNEPDLKFPDQEYLTLSNWKRGVISLIDKSRLPKDALEEADNLFLVEDGQPSPRPGVNFFGTAPSGDDIDGFDYFDFNGAIHLLVAAGGVIYRSTDDGTTWSSCTGATPTAGTTLNMNQNGGYMYMTNGVDPIIRYDGTTTLQTYTALSTPSAPTVAHTGLGTTNYQYLYKVSAVNRVGFTIASSVGTGDTKFTLTRDGWSSTAYVTLTLSAVTGATRYDIYISEDGVDYFYLDSAVPPTVGAATTYRDDGSAIPIPSTTAPVDNTTTGPLVEELVNVGSRMYGVRDTDNRHRIWFTSGNPNFAGSFSNAYDGGYLDWQTGGKYIPVKVEDYRDGKGTPLATIWCKSADDQGCVLQMSLDTLTVGEISITVPSAYRLPGSRGTGAPGSVVNVLNDFMFYNSQAFYNLGSRAQFLNLLSTDEASANIRPSVRQISSAGESMIASVYFEAKVYFSVPYGSSTNNHTIVYDTERKAWLPKAFTIGFSKFLRYTDTSSSRRLLALRPGDSQLSEISTNIQGDYGEAFSTSLLTGLYPVLKNRFEFQYVEEAEFEFSNPQGEINLELIGIERTQGFSTQKTASVSSTTSQTGWSTFLWSSTAWSDTSNATETFSESSTKRYFTVLKELNAVQWHITTNALGSGYVLRTLQTHGAPTQAGKPAAWRLT